MFDIINWEDIIRKYPKSFNIYYRFCLSENANYSIFKNLDNFISDYRLYNDDFTNFYFLISTNELYSLYENESCIFEYYDKSDLIYKIFQVVEKLIQNKNE